MFSPFACLCDFAAGIPMAISSRRSLSKVGDSGRLLSAVIIHGERIHNKRGGTAGIQGDIRDQLSRRNLDNPQGSERRTERLAARAAFGSELQQTLMLFERLLKPVRPHSRIMAGWAAQPWQAERFGQTRAISKLRGTAGVYMQRKGGAIPPVTSAGIACRVAACFSRGVTLGSAWERLAQEPRPESDYTE